MLEKYLKLYTADQTRNLDNLAIENAGWTEKSFGYDLMKRAGASVTHFITSTWPETKNMVVFCGVGNNGGDGYIIAKLSNECGINVKVIQLGDLTKQHGDALTARINMESDGLFTETFKADVDNIVKNTDVVVDAMIGTGLQRTVSGDLAQAINVINHYSSSGINQAGVKVVSVDIPSGLNADTGSIQGSAIKAHMTVTFIGRKQGLYTAEGPEHSGEIKFDALSISENTYTKIPPDCYLLPVTLSRPFSTPRKKNTHKGTYGNVIVVGGAPGMNGAILLTATAALRSGCGLVTVLTHPQHASFLNLTRPEIMCRGIKSATELDAYLSGADVIIIGPGLGTGHWGNELFNGVLEKSGKLNIPLVIDADGVNLLAHLDVNKGDHVLSGRISAEEMASHKSSLYTSDIKLNVSKKKNNEIELNHLKKENQNWVLTPHPGEAANLLKCSITIIQNDRFSAATQISQKYNVMCVLKGSGTITSTINSENSQGSDKKQSRQYVCSSGNPGMATAGMGDVLSGIIASFIAQFGNKNNDSVSFSEIVNNAVMLHAMAGDRVAKKYGEKGMLASDLFSEIRSVLKENQDGW